MKLSELSYRDYIAIEVLPGIVGRYSVTKSSDAAQKAYRVADAMLVEAGKRDHELEELRERAEKAERTLEILRPTAPEDFILRVALDEIWLALGVNNQTVAMQKLQELLGQTGD